MINAYIQWDGDDLLEVRAFTDPPASSTRTPTHVYTRDGESWLEDGEPVTDQSFVEELTLLVTPLLNPEPEPEV